MNGTGLRPWLRRERQPARRGFESALSELFGDFFETSDAGTVPLMTRGQWVPSLDVTDNVETVLVAAELPGMSKDDVTISFADSTLTLEGEKRSEYESNEEGKHHVERSYGKFLRRIKVPFDIDVEKIGAQFKDGVLRITLPKSPAARIETRSIPIEEA